MTSRIGKAQSVQSGTKSCEHDITQLSSKWCDRSPKDVKSVEHLDSIVRRNSVAPILQQRLLIFVLIVSRLSAKIVNETSTPEKLVSSITTDGRSSPLHRVFYVRQSIWTSSARTGTSLTCGVKTVNFLSVLIATQLPTKTVNNNTSTSPSHIIKRENENRRPQRKLQQQHNSQSNQHLPWA